MTNRHLARCLTAVTFAYMAGFVALYVDKLWEAFR
jgi:hypothetical protein